MTLEGAIRDCIKAIKYAGSQRELTHMEALAGYLVELKERRRMALEQCVENLKKVVYDKPIEDGLSDDDMLNEVIKRLPVSNGTPFDVKLDEDTTAYVREWLIELRDKREMFEVSAQTDTCPCCGGELKC